MTSFLAIFIICPCNIYAPNIEEVEGHVASAAFWGVRLSVRYQTISKTIEVRALKLDEDIGSDK